MRKGTFKMHAKFLAFNQAIYYKICKIIKCMGMIIKILLILRNLTVNRKNYFDTKFNETFMSVIETY